MADEPQVKSDDPEKIREEMERTRASLAEKLETLENKVTGTVQETVETVSEKVQETVAAVSDTVSSVKETMASSVETVKETFNIPLQVQRHPWAMVGGSFAVGLLGGWLLGGSSRTSRSSRSSLSAPMSGTGYYEEPAAHRRSGNGAAFQGRQESGWLGSLFSSLAPEMDKLKGMAVGTLGTLVRDLITDALPENMRHQASQLIEDFTTRLGGQPLQGRLLPESCATDASCTEDSTHCNR
jgi:ElaB/YqjD/DUF883 family membrane-anchored ribosome-binding protein